MHDHPKLSDLHKKLIQWSRETSHLIADILDTCRPLVGNNSKLNAKENEIFWQLLASCQISSESVLLLVANQHLWDADILVRSVVEGTFKLVFLTLGTDPERAEKLLEFEECFMDISRIKNHKRLEGFLTAIPNPDVREWRPYREMLLKPEDLRKLEEKYPKKLRQKLDQKWSFSAISAAFGKSDQKGLTGFQHLVFNYGMSSHFAHKDAIGIGVVWDRNNRNDLRREVVELAHGGRLVNDVCVMALLRAHVLHVLTKQSHDMLKPLSNRYEAINKETHIAGERFNEVEYGTL